MLVKIFQTTFHVKICYVATLNLCNLLLLLVKNKKKAERKNEKSLVEGRFTEAPKII